MNKIEKIKVTVDIDELRSGIYLMLLDDRHFSVNSELLRCGDYLIADTIIQRITTDALINSLKSGRFLRQITTLSMFHPSRVLIIEGNKDHLYYIIPRLEALLYKVTFKFKMPILWSKGPFETGLIIRRIIRFHHDIEASQNIALN